MTTSRLRDIAVREHGRIAGLRGSRDDMLLYLAKVTEELGEVASEVADCLGAPEEPVSDALQCELADLIISAAVLGQALGVDLDAALERRAIELDLRWRQRGQD